MIWNLPAAATVAMAQASNAASVSVREKATHSARLESEGQLGVREEAYTDDVAKAIDDMTGTFSSVLLAGDHEGYRVSIKTSKITSDRESRYGLDLGIRLTSKAPGSFINKSILVQCKRMKGQGATGKFRAERCIRQANDMLAVTPASFFFLFSGGHPDELRELATGSTDSKHDFGVAVIPATRVQSYESLPTSAADLLRGSVSLEGFMSDYFGRCFVGDVSLRAALITTPPELHGDLWPVELLAGDYRKAPRRELHIRFESTKMSQA